MKLEPFARTKRIISTHSATSNTFVRHMNWTGHSANAPLLIGQQKMWLCLVPFSVRAGSNKQQDEIQLFGNEESLAAHTDPIEQLNALFSDRHEYRQWNEILIFAVSKWTTLSAGADFSNDAQVKTLGRKRKQIWIRYTLGHSKPDSISSEERNDLNGRIVGRRKHEIWNGHK